MKKRFILLAIWVLALVTTVAYAQSVKVESLGYKVHSTYNFFGAESALKSWIKDNPSTEIVAFGVDKKKVFIVSK